MEQQENNIQQQGTLAQTFKIRGMKTDLSESSFENSFAFENKNMRINIVDEDNTLLNLTNERGTLYSCKVSGIPVGVKKYDIDRALLFTTNNRGDTDISSLRHKDFSEGPEQLMHSDFDNIDDFVDSVNIVYEDDGEIRVKNILTGNIGLNASNPLEIEHYKDGDTDYFYIADGLNNFKTFVLKNDHISISNSNLDYNCKIDGSERITAESIKSHSGEFFSGVIVYCFAYVTKQGHKTGIIDITDCKMLSNYGRERGLAPNTRCNVAYDIRIENTSSDFAGVEVYSLYRSSLDGDIVVRKVQECKNNVAGISVIDNNTGEIISYQELLTRFNSRLVASTITQKNNTLFLGNIKTNNYQNLRQIIKSASTITLNTTNDNFSNLNDYYFGIQFQDKYGVWSPVSYIGRSNNVTSAILPKSLCETAISNGYVAFRIMRSYNYSQKNVICAGVALSAITIENGKYGIDYYSPYSCSVGEYDIYDQFSRIKSYATTGRNPVVFDIYSPDCDFNENLIINNDSDFRIYYNSNTVQKVYTNIDVTINGNTGVLYNSNSSELGVASWNGERFIWKDAIVGYQKALQLLFCYDKGSGSDISNDKIVSSLYDISKLNLEEKPTDYVIYTWQPSGSLNDSNGSTSILKTKRISFVYETRYDQELKKSENNKLWLYDTTTNNISLSGDVYAGIVNHDIYPQTWSIPEELRNSNEDGDGGLFWDDDQILYVDNYSLATLDTYKYNGQPIEVYGNNIDPNNSKIVPIWRYSAKTKSYNENEIEETSGEDIAFNRKAPRIKYWAATSSLGIINLVNVYDRKAEYEGRERTKDTIKIRVTNRFNRSNSIKISYKTPKHFVTKLSYRNDSCSVLVTNNSGIKTELNDSQIENGEWIVCSKKVKLSNDEITVSDIDIDDTYKWDVYQCLKTEPYSLSDINQVTCVLNIRDVYSYINPFCRYDNLVAMSNYNGVTSSIFNKMNMVYNQKNNFFVYPGITESTITDDSLENTILYSEMKLANEKEDTFVNFDTTNFYTIDSYVNKINKLEVYNDKLLCFSDSSLVQILYNENVVVNTDSVQSLGLASTDKITGSQLLTNTYGCVNKWSIGVYNNVLYFSDDLNNKIIAFAGEFTVINEEFGIETLNKYLFDLSVWDPLNWRNTKLNIDKYSKDVHYTTSKIDVALNPQLGAFTSLYSYEKIPFIETISKYSVAFKYNDGFTEIHLLRQGNYNYFFGKYEPYWTTVIINQNSLVTKTLSNIEFSTEAYSENIPNNQFTFDTVTLWNDYQCNKTRVDYKMYGQSLLKKKFRIWRVNRLRNGTKTDRRNYDMISNPWSYLKLSSETENTNKLTLHWINLNYKNE